MNASTVGIIPGSTTGKIVAALLILFVAIIILFALNAKYKFLPTKWNLFQNLGLSKSEDGVYWNNPSSMTTLSLTQTQLPSNFPSRYGYSMMFDTMIFNSRASMSAATGGVLPYRHILHRGSNDLGNAGTAGGCGGGGTGTGSTTGLPASMNPGFLADPTTNDILVFIDTSSGRESARISNIQLATPYRIGIIVYKGFFEVYLGCKLLTTQVLQGIPIAINPSGVYALAGSNALSAKIQNLRLWNTTIPVQQVITECGAPIQAFGTAPPCVAAAAAAGATTTAPATSLTGSTTAPVSSGATIADTLQCPTHS